MATRKWLVTLYFEAPVAQWIERRFPKPQVACSIHAGGTILLKKTLELLRFCNARYSPPFFTIGGVSCGDPMSASVAQN